MVLDLSWSWCVVWYHPSRLNDVCRHPAGFAGVRRRYCNDAMLDKLNANLCSQIHNSGTDTPYVHRCDAVLRAYSGCRVRVKVWNPGEPKLTPMDMQSRHEKKPRAQPQAAILNQPHGSRVRGKLSHGVAIPPLADGDFCRLRYNIPLGPFCSFFSFHPQWPLSVGKRVNSLRLNWRFFIVGDRRLAVGGRSWVLAGTAELV